MSTEVISHGEAHFGYLPRSLTLQTQHCAIATLDGLSEAFRKVGSSPSAERGWVYAAPGSRVFGLPKTHTLRWQAADTGYPDFMLWCLGFLTGTRLTRTEAGFLDATPIEPGKLVDFVCLGQTLQAALELADVFYEANQGSPAPKLLASTIHSLFIAQGPQLLCFERLWYLYTALDSCWKTVAISKNLKTPRHAKRVEELCKALAVPVPDWGQYDAGNNNSPLSSIRNATLHEGLFVGEPLGSAVLRGFDGTDHQLNNPLLEVEHLLCRLIVSLLGVHDRSYLDTPVSNRQKLGLSCAPTKPMEATLS